MSAVGKDGLAGGLDDLLFVEHVEIRRALVGMAGTYRLKNWRDAQGKQREFACEIVKILPQAITFAASVTGPVGEWVFARFPQLGNFEGPIVQVAQRRIVMRIVGTQQERDKLATRIAWAQDTTKPEERRFERLVPAQADASFSVGAGHMEACTLIDFSISAAAVQAETTPEIGAPLTIGKVAGRVVRHFNGGFAVNFAAVQDPQLVEALLQSPAAGTPA